MEKIASHRRRKMTNSDKALTTHWTLGQGHSHSLLVTSPSLGRVIISSVSQKLGKAINFAKGHKDHFWTMEMCYILTVVVVMQAYTIERLYLAQQGLFKSQPASVYTPTFTYIYKLAKP